jgi:pimeloyl-ACP methyl ester carboxylesterase
MEPRRTYVDTPWGQVHYRSGGTGEPLLLLHSSSGSSRVFRRLMMLMDGHRCIAPDLAGFGESAPMPAGASIEEVAAHVVSFLDAIGIERAHVFGLHSGNKVAAAMAANWPARVARLVIAGMTHSLVVDRAHRNDAVLRYAGRSDAGSNDDAQVRKDLCGKLDKVLHDPYVPLTSSGTPDVERLAVEILDTVQARDGANLMYPANLAFDLAETLKRVAAPSLVIELVTEGEAGLGRQGTLLAGLMKDCRAVALAGNDRELLQARPAELVELLREFIQA